MNSNEIIKALECCVVVDGCKKCPRSENGKICRSYDYDKFIRAILDLINRQKAKIEELEDKHWNECRQIAHYEDELRQAKAEIEQFADIGKMYSEIKSDAIKKFAESLKSELKNLSKVNLFGNTFSLVSESFADRFVEKYEKGEENG